MINSLIINQVRRLEELSMNAHPAINTIHYDGWILRFAGGYTKRANSINILYSSVIETDEKINYCNKLYKERNLPVVYKITPLSLEMDEKLKVLSYEDVDRSYVMTMDINNGSKDKLSSIVISNIEEQWQNSYVRLNKLKEELIPFAKAIQNSIVHQSICATLAYDGKIIACGLCVVEDGHAGLYDIIVAREHRGKGYGRDICNSLLNEAIKYGANKAYLQVVANNTSARKLYEKLGFTYCYQYWYRVKK